MPADAAPPLTAAPPAWTPTPALTAALARLLLRLADRDRETAPPNSERRPEGPRVGVALAKGST
jgi:hypothetical protein